MQLKWNHFKKTGWLITFYLPQYFMLHSDYDMDACEQEFYNVIESMYCKLHLRIDV